jgi:hypothetical protein
MSFVGKNSLYRDLYIDTGNHGQTSVKTVHTIPVEKLNTPVHICSQLHTPVHICSHFKQMSMVIANDLFGGIGMTNRKTQDD